MEIDRFRKGKMAVKAKNKMDENKKIRFQPAMIP